jgi:hypothetical protein
MSDAIAPGTMIPMRVVRRYSHYNVGDEIALDLASAQDAYRKRLADPIGTMLVPVPIAATPGADPPGPSAPLRQPGAIVRK